MGKVPATVPFKQPMHGQGKTTSAKNKSKVGFKQNPAIKGAGKTSSKKNKSEVSFVQPSKGSGGKSSKKNPSKVGFEQPNRAGKTASTLSFEGKNVGKGAKVKPAGKVAPPAGKFKSIDQVVAYRKKKYGV